MTSACYSKIYIAAISLKFQCGHKPIFFFFLNNIVLFIFIFFFTFFFYFIYLLLFFVAIFVLFFTFFPDFNILFPFFVYFILLILFIFMQLFINISIFFFSEVIVLSFTVTGTGALKPGDFLYSIPLSIASSICRTISPRRPLKQSCNDNFSGNIQLPNPLVKSAVGGAGILLVHPQPVLH